MVPAILSLRERLNSSHALASKNEAGDIADIPAFPNLTKILSKLDFGKVRKEKQQNAQRIANAISILKKDPNRLSKVDWRLVFWGLNYPIEVNQSLLQSSYFEIVQAKVTQITNEGDISKREWFALCASYFSYTGEDKNNSNFESLRNLLLKAFKVIEKNQLKAKPWLLTVKNNLFLLSTNAENEFAKLIVSNEEDRISEINQIFPISDSSWLWKKTFANLKEILAKIDDKKFISYLLSLIALITKYPVHQNIILAAILTRYYESSDRKTTHPQLKVIALNMWGSPQLKTSKNTWLVNVSNDVVNMVLRWFAKDDLEHFFKLLKTESGVDQRRLNFWIDYVDQISFTKIVLGRDALYNNSLDFKNFRQENKGRLSELQSATSNNNAFIMQIKDYWFVEFSETGNACYVYEEGALPFDPNDRRLDLKVELKMPHLASERILHSSEWEDKATYLLKRLHIYK